MYRVTRIEMDERGEGKTGGEKGRVASSWPNSQILKRPREKQRLAELCGAPREFIALEQSRVPRVFARHVNACSSGTGHMKSGRG